MKRFIWLMIVGVFVFASVGAGYQRREDRIRGRDGRMVRRYRFDFNDRTRSNPYRANPYRGCSPYLGYEQYRYPGVDLHRYDMMPYYSPRYYVNPFYNGGSSVLEHWRN